MQIDDKKPAHVNFILTNAFYFFNSSDTFAAPIHLQNYDTLLGLANIYYSGLSELGDLT